MILLILAVVTQPNSSETSRKLVNYSPSFSVADSNVRKNSAGKRNSISGASTDTDISSSTTSSSSSSSTNRNNNMIEQMFSKPKSAVAAAKKKNSVDEDGTRETGNDSSKEAPSLPQPQPSRLSTQYSSERAVVKLNNHYTITSRDGDLQSKPTISTKYHRNELKSIFSLLSNKPKISSRLNRYRFDASGSSRPQNQSTTQLPSSPHPIIGRSASCDFVAAAASLNLTSLAIASDKIATTTAGAAVQPAHPKDEDYSTIPVIDYTNEDYVITRL